MRPTLPRLFLAAAFLAFASSLALYGPARAQTPAPSPAPTASSDTGDDSGAPAETPPPIPSPKPAPDDPKIHKLAVQQFLAWQTATVDRDLYADTVNGQLTDDVMDRATKTLANMGALQSTTFLGISKTKDVSLYVYKMTCVYGSVNMDFSLQPDGKIGLIFFV